MIAHASAPVRLDLAGGWTDVAPFAVEQRGAVVSVAIELRARVEIELGGVGWQLDSRDLEQVREFADPREMAKDGVLDLLKAAVRMSGIGPCRITTRSDAPPGSGLGSSGALDVALIAAIDRTAGRIGPPAEIAERAWNLEAVEAELPGGRQDQYAAAFGGWNRFVFDHGRVGVEAIPLDSAVASAIAERTVICYTGQSRISSRTVARVIQAYVDRDPGVTGALFRMVELADEMMAAIAAGDLSRMGAILAANWTCQQQLAAGMRTDAMAVLERRMMEHGALGGKAAGAGTGGSMFFLFPEPEAAASAAEAAGVATLPAIWARDGVLVW